MSITLEQLLQAHETDAIIAQPGTPIVNITDRDARRKANSYLGRDVSLMMHGIDPALVLSEGQLVWRIPIELATPRQGHIGFIGTLDVDAHTGELIVPATFVEEIEANARALLKSASHPAEVER